MHQIWWTRQTLETSVTRTVSRFFSTSDSGSDNLLLAQDCANLVNYRKSTDHPMISKDTRFSLVFLVFYYLWNYWDYETTDNFLFLRVSFNHFEGMRKKGDYFKWKLNLNLSKKSTTKSTKLRPNEIIYSKHT